MFARVLALLPFALLVSASHLEARNVCNSGSVYCCNSAQTVDQESSLLNRFGLANAAAQIGGLVGVSCTSVAVLGGSASCSATQQTVCCLDNQFNGAINLGCNNIQA